MSLTLPLPFLQLLACLLVASSLAAATEYQPGHSYYGSKNYIEYIAGDLPLVISAPHGGREEPDEIPSRTQGVVEMDSNSQELARAIEEEIHARTGHYAHFIICRLHRKKLDCNREIEEAAGSDPIAGKAWSEYHDFIDSALAAARAQAGRAFFIDLHGQNHRDHRIELGYLHSPETLEKPDNALNSAEIAAQSSLRFIAQQSKLPYSDLLRGPHSLGALFEAKGFPSTPSPTRPTPILPYFQGGYTVHRHVAPDAPVAGLQIETNLAGIRDSAENRAKFAAAFVPVITQFLHEQFNLDLPPK